MRNWLVRGSHDSLNSVQMKSTYGSTIEIMINT